ncbi:MAG: hypothetical protein DRI44_01180 [Chlamydiae bacterium]|nr:MAG: hypothetical protein DRI44_01180 [Chlamydiota bacterium]
MSVNKKEIKKIRVPQQTRSKAKVDRIISAARVLFSKIGYAKTTMAKIAKAANVSTGTAYSYFADKNDILRKIFEEHVENILQPAEELMDSLNRQSSVQSTLKRLIMTALQSKEEIEMHKIFLEQMMKDIDFQTVGAGYCDRGLEICKKLVLRFGNKKAKKDLEASAQVIVGLLDVCTHINTLYPAKISREKACDIGIAMIIAYFK